MAPYRQLYTRGGQPLYGTARVQLVKPDCKSVIRQILEEYYELTGVPMILNTSLNIRNKPMVNTIEDAIEWENKYKVRVF